MQPKAGGIGAVTERGIPAASLGQALSEQLEEVGFDFLASSAQTAEPE
jgi:hypothetical protein